MANLGENFPPDIRCVFVETNLDTHLAVLVHKDDTVSHFKENFCKEHKQSLPDIGEICISAVKVKRRNCSYHFPDSMILSKVFKGISEDWFIDVDAAKVEKGDLLTIEDADQNRLNNQAPERGKEIANCSNHTLEAETKTKKRKMERSDGKKIRKKSSADVSETAVATTSSGYDADENRHEICGKVQVAAVASKSDDVEKQDDLRGPTEQALEKKEKTAELVKIDQEKVKGPENCSNHTLESETKIRKRKTERSDGKKSRKKASADVSETAVATTSSGYDADENRHEICGTVQVEAFASKSDDVEKQDDLRGPIEPALEKGEKIAELVKIDQEKDLASTLKLINGHMTSRDAVNESHEVTGEVQVGVNPIEEVSRCSCEGKKTRKLVIFDLNGILADVVQDYIGPFVPDGKISNRSVFKRPFVTSFLDFCFQKFNVAIWSSRRIGLTYMTNTVMGSHAGKLLFSFDQHMCTTTKFNTLEKSTKPLFLKDLKRVWNRFGTCFVCGKLKYDEANTLLVDDSPHKALCNPPHTGIFPFPYQYTDRRDSALGPDGELRKYLEKLVDVEDVQKFVEENPIGQVSITETHESWEFYSKVIKAYK